MGFGESRGSYETLHPKLNVAAVSAGEGYSQRSQQVPSDRGHRRMIDNSMSALESGAQAVNRREALTHRQGCRGATEDSAHRQHSQR